VTSTAEERERAVRSVDERRWLSTWTPRLWSMWVLTRVNSTAGVSTKSRQTCCARSSPWRAASSRATGNVAGCPHFLWPSTSPWGDSEGEARCYPNESSPSFSRLPMEQAHQGLSPFTSEISSQRVTLRRLDTSSRSMTVRRGRLTKTDVQDAEAQVLRGGPRLLDRADAVIADVGYLALYDGQATIGDISSALAEDGLAFMGIVDQYLRPGDSLPVYGDALFVRLGSLPQVLEDSRMSSIL